MKMYRKSWVPFPNPSRAWKEGKLSNFPVCCIVYFILREPFMWLRGFFPWPGYFWKFREMISIDTSYRHCPFHSIWYRIVGCPKWEKVDGERRLV